MKGARIRSDTGAACIPAALYNPAHCVVARKHTAIRLGGDVGCVSERVGANRIFYPAERIRRTSCGKPPHATTMIPTVSEILHRLQPLEVAAKCCAVAGAYLSGYAITSHFHEASSLTGAMLACTSAIVVQQQQDFRHSVQQGWLRVLGTFIGAVVAYFYLLLFSFSIVGMVLTVCLEEVVCMLFAIPDNGKMATITLVIVLLVSVQSPDLTPLQNGVLRFSEATVGAVVGVVVAWCADRIRRRLRRQADGVSGSGPKK